MEKKNKEELFEYRQRLKETKYRYKAGTKMSNEAIRSLISAYPSSLPQSTEPYAPTCLTHDGLSRGEIRHPRPGVCEGGQHHQPHLCHQPDQHGR